MADFKGTVLTQAGRNILAKALTGAQLQFTKVQLGDGVWDESINPEDLTALVSSKIDLPINDIEITGDGTARIRVLLINTGLTEGFFTRELGIFAKDPETGEETLYAVSYAENPDFIPSEGVTKVENIFDVYTVISNAQNVTAVISDTVVLATKQDIEKHNQDPNAHNGLINADKVDGFDASPTPSAKTIPVANAEGFLNSWIKQGPGSGFNADKVDGYNASQTPTANTIPVADAEGFINAWIKQGAGSGLDADLIGGFHVSDIAWKKIHEADLNDMGSYLVSGLNGDLHKVYLIIVKGVVGENTYNFIQVNNDSENYINVNHVAEIGGSNLHQLEDPGSSGLSIGRAPSASLFQSISYFFALSGLGNRLLIGQAGAGDSNIKQTHVFTGWWLNNSDNVVSLNFIFSQSFTGKVLIYSLE